MSGHDDDDDEDLRSRTDLSKQRKADEKRLAALATALVGLSAKQLDKIELDEELRDAVDEGRRMTAHAARARQLRIVRRELRSGDHAAIAAAVDDLVNPRGAPSPAARAAQLWVGRFLDEGNDAVEGFLADHPHADRQRLNALVRNARKAAAVKTDAGEPDTSKIGNANKARKTLTAAVQDWMRDVPPT